MKRELFSWASRRSRRRVLKAISLPFTKLASGWASLRRISLRGMKKAFRRFWFFKEPDWTKAPAAPTATASGERSLAGTLNPTHWLGWGFSMLYSWIVSRPYRNLGPAIPAVAVVSVFLLVIFWESVQGAGWRNSQYRRSLDIALQSEDFDTAKIASLRLIERNPDDNNLRLQNALIEYSRGNTDLARGLIAQLASQRHGPSAYWLLVNDYPLESLTTWDQQKHLGFQQTMDLVRSGLDDNRKQHADLILADYLTQMGAHADALKLLAEIVTKHPEVSVIGMNLAYQLQNYDEAQRFAETAVVYLTRQLESEPNSSKYRLDLAKALVVLKREQEAIDQLQSGVRLLRTSLPEEAEKLQAGVGEVLVEYALRLSRERPLNETLLKRLEVINQALGIAPNNMAVVNATIEIILECEQNQENQILVLRDALLQGAAPEAVHFIQGTLDLLKGDSESARNHLQIAKATGMNTPGILNNLAMSFLESTDSATLERALELSTSAVNALPEHPYLRDTRGRLLLKLRRYEEAIPELELALNAPELAAEAHGLLADAYTALNQTDLAEGHRQLAAQGAPSRAETTGGQQPEAR